LAFIHLFYRQIGLLAIVCVLVEIHHLLNFLLQSGRDRKRIRRATAWINIIFVDQNVRIVTLVIVIFKGHDSSLEEIIVLPISFLNDSFLNEFIIAIVFVDLGDFLHFYASFQKLRGRNVGVSKKFAQILNFLNSHFLGYGRVVRSDVWFLRTVFSLVTPFFTTHAFNQRQINLIIMNLIVTQIASLVLSSPASLVINALLAAAPPQQAAVFRLMSLTTPIEIIFFFILLAAVLALLHFVIRLIGILVRFQDFLFQHYNLFFIFGQFLAEFLDLSAV
jgi:hypothetical protein